MTPQEAKEYIYDCLDHSEATEVIKALEQQPCEDCISREETLKVFAEKCGGECACCEYNGSGYDTAENCKLIKSMPSVTPSIPDVEDNFDIGYNCGYADAMCDIGGES